MLNVIYQRYYPYLSIGFLEIFKHIENIQSFSEIVSIVFQVIIGALTVFKLSKDLKNKLKNKNNE